MIELNEDQKLASKPEGGITLVIAGAGTGKTSTMISKIRNVIEHSIVRPEQVLILTFSRKAAVEIQERLASKLTHNAQTGFSGTFHSFALKILQDNKEHYLKQFRMNSFPSVLESGEKEIIMRKIIMEIPENFLGMPVDVISHISGNMNHLNEKLLTKLKSGTLFNEIQNIKALFDKYKKENMLLEFEDMINHAAELLESNLFLKQSINDKYRFIFIDEFQDTSENNFRLLQQLIPEQRINLYMVGDDYQSIYKFRNSRVEYIINAKKFFPGISIHKLTVNYRSNKEIITISNKFIKLNKFRTSKKIYSKKGKGGKVKFHSVEDMNHESDVINRIVKSSGSSSIAVLYRNNYQGDYLRKHCKSEESSKNIEFFTMHGSKGLEFDIVIIAGISDKIIPDRSSDIEEERRLFYVALTRAKSELHLLYYLNGNEKLPRFVREIGYKKK